MLKEFNREYDVSKVQRWQREFVSVESPTAKRNLGGSHPCQGLYYTPLGRRPKVAFIAAHYNGDNSGQYLASYLAERGFSFLGWNTRYRGAEAYFLLEHALLDIGAGVRWLREQAGIEQVVILGNSGGGSLMAAYQSQAIGVTMTAPPDLTLPEALGDLDPGEFYVSLCAHRGRPEIFTNWLDPSVTDENDSSEVESSLDMYNPENGPPYAEAFIESYRAAQVARNRKITRWCYAEIDRLKRRDIFDRVFNVNRTWADLRFLDGNIDPSDRKLNSCYGGDPKLANYGTRGLGVTCTLRTWFSMWSLEDSHCKSEHHLKRINVPALVVQGTADTGIYPRDAQFIYDQLGSSDKAIEMIPGDHYLSRPDGARDNAANIISSWLVERL